MRPMLRHTMVAMVAALTALTALTAVACADATAPAFPSDAPPSAFHINYSGWIYGSHDVLLRGDTLVVSRVPDFRPDGALETTVVPTASDWRAFWRAADAAGVRSWPRECIDRNIADGGGLSMRIDYAGGHVETTTSNSTPHRDGTCGGTAEGDDYHALLAAVAALIGRPFP